MFHFLMELFNIQKIHRRWFYWEPFPIPDWSSFAFPDRMCVSVGVSGERCVLHQIILQTWENIIRMMLSTNG